MGSSAPAVKAALIATLGDLFPPPVLVSYGSPGSYLPEVIIGVLDQEIEHSRPTMGTRRSREEQVTTAVTVSVFKAGDERVQQEATERAWDLYDQLSEHFRTRGNETLGGACREAWVTEGVLTESVTYEEDGFGRPTNVAIGRVAEITASVISHARRD